MQAVMAKYKRPLIDTLGSQRVLDSVGDELQRSVERLLKKAGPAANLIEQTLHGAPLGHPLHPALIAVPIGAWTVTQIGDLIEALSGDRGAAQLADGSLVIGLLGALAAAVTGLTDWKDTDGTSRRVGLLHGMLNAGATALYAWSLGQRLGRRRGAARTTALAGYSLVTLASFLGGELVYELGVGINHAERTGAPESYVAVLSASELGEGELRQVEVGGRPVVLARQSGRIYALAATCAHLGGPLADGQLEDGAVRCPWHGSLFRLEDGAPLEGPSAFAQPCLAVAVRENQIEVRATETGE